MMRCLLLVLALGFAEFLGCECLAYQAPSKHWSYHGDKGPEHWCSLFSQKNQGCCGHRQSPIDINTKNVEFTNNWLRVTNLDSYWDITTIKNIGHTVTITLNGSRSDLPQLTLFQTGEDGYDRPISEDYTFELMHFHFGLFSDRGAEHTINGKAYPMEMHMIFYKTRFVSYDQAKMKADGLVVIGVLFEISPKDNQLLQPLIKRLPYIAYQMEEEIMPAISPGNFLPKDINKYYSYEGSVTTPLCYEVVTWYLLKHRVPISEIQMAHFRQLTKQGLSAQIIEGHQHHNNGHNFVFDNFRPLQPLNGRIITENNPDISNAVTEPTVELHTKPPYTCTRWRCYPFGSNFPHDDNTV